MKIPLKNYHKDFCQKEIIKLYNLNLFVFFHFNKSSNNTNKLSPQELAILHGFRIFRSNNTNKLSPQELGLLSFLVEYSSNNTNKLSPQELL